MLLAECPLCYRYNFPTSRVGQTLQPILSSKPGDLLLLDIHGPLPYSSGYRYVFVAIDHFSKFSFARRTRRASARIATHFLQDIFSQAGSFQEVLTDAGVQFTATLFQTTVTRLGALPHTTGTAHYEATGCIERFVRTINGVLAKTTEHPGQWSSRFLDAVNQYNQTPHTVTSQAPAAVFFGQPVQLQADDQFGVTPPQLPTPETILENMRRKRLAMTQQHDKSRHQFAPGQIVSHVPRLPSQKKHDANRRFRPRRFGPFRIVRIGAHNKVFAVDENNRGHWLPAWELQLHRGPVYHGSKLPGLQGSSAPSFNGSKNPGLQEGPFDVSAGGPARSRLQGPSFFKSPPGWMVGATLAGPRHIRSDYISNPNSNLCLSTLPTEITAGKPRSNPDDVRPRCMPPRHHSGQQCDSLPRALPCDSKGVHVPETMPMGPRNVTAGVHSPLQNVPGGGWSCHIGPRQIRSWVQTFVHSFLLHFHAMHTG